MPNVTNKSFYVVSPLYALRRYNTKAEAVDAMEEFYKEYKGTCDLGVFRMACEVTLQLPPIEPDTDDPKEIS